MSKQHPKFSWIEAVYAERRFTMADKAVLVYCAIHFVRGAQDDFAARQITIAHNCGCGVATVKRAFARARELGYLATQRPPRGRNLHSGDQHRMTFPNDLGINLILDEAGHEPDLGINTIPDPGPSRDQPDQSKDQPEPIQGSDRADLGINAEAVTSENVAPKGFNKGFIKGFNTPYVSNARERAEGFMEPVGDHRTDGSQRALARFGQLNRYARSPAADAIAAAYSASLPVPVEAGLLAQIAAQVDKCLRAEIPAKFIAEGLYDWTISGAWSTNQIPSFVHKAANRSRRNGKPTTKALGYDQACAELIEEITNQ